MTNRQIDKFILVGLGNPGEKYEDTRHNAGKMFIRWAREEGRRKKEEGHTEERFEAIESESFMNESGQWVARWLTQKEKGKRTRFDSARREKEKLQTELNSLHPSSISLLPLIVVHDDLDILLGNFKIQFGKGPKQHYGVLSIEEALGTKEFWRIRIGIENRLRGQKADRLKNQPSSLPAFQPANLSFPGSDYVLSRFSKEEWQILSEEVFPKIEKGLERIVCIR